MANVSRQSVLDRIVEERVGLTVVGGVSTAIDRIADEIAKEAMQDEAFRRSIRDMVRRHSEALLARLVRDERAASRPRRARARSR